MMECVKQWFMSSQSQAVMSMLFVQVIATGTQLLSRVVLLEGTFIFSLIAYRYVIATLCVAPFALYFERGHPKKLNWAVWFWVFLNALVGITIAMFFYYGLRDTSATYSVNFLNLVPVFTFLVSIIFRMEKLGLETWAGKAKAIGTIICVGGALITSLYTGKQFYIGYHRHSSHTSSNEQPKAHMLRGTIFLVACCFSYTGWFIVQVKLLKALPLKIWATMLTCIMATFQTGAFATAATFSLTSWVVTLKEPTYPPMFNPLAFIFVAFSGAILLGEPLKVGTMVGMVLIMAGLYGFLWGKTKETQSLTQPNEAAAGEASTTVMTPDSAGLPSMAILVPSSSSYSSRAASRHD